MNDIPADISPRPHLSTKERLRLFMLHGGICHICKRKIDGAREAWDIEHVLARGLGGDESDENRKPAHRGGKCHKEKTKRDIKAIAKTKRVRAKHFGAQAPSRFPLPGGRNSKWKRKVGGGVVPRDQEN